MPRFDEDTIEGAHKLAREERVAPVVLTESQRRLDELKRRIADELLAERRLREIEKGRPRLDPLSLAPANEGKRPRQATALDHSFHVLVQSLKLDSWVQRELEGELDRKSQEMDALQAHNERLREIITLRQEANQRREVALQAELDRLRGITRRAAPADLTAAMDELRGMKDLVNAGADTLYDTLKARAVSERLALVRTFTVRIRDVQQLIAAQRDENTRGAQEWIDRYGTLEREHDVTASEAAALRSEVGALQSDVHGFEATTCDGRERYQALIDELASLKADNRRLDEHCERLRLQVADVRARSTSPPSRSPGPSGGAAHGSGGGHQPGRQQRRAGSVTPPPLSRPSSGAARGDPRAISPASSASSSRPTSALDKHNNNNHRQQHQQHQAGASATAAGARPQPPRLPPRVPHASSEERAAVAVRRLRATLDEMKTRIKHVRAAHIEHLQERTELELFLRQCVEDVRKDLERASSTDVHFRFSPEEKQRVCDVLAAKLRVLTALHKRTFPNKLSVALDVNFPVDIVMQPADGSPTVDAVFVPVGHGDGAAAAVSDVSRRGVARAVESVRGGAMASDTANRSAAAAMPQMVRSGDRGGSAGRSRKPPRASSATASGPAPPSRQDAATPELMDSLWSKWQVWNDNIAGTPSRKKRGS